MLFRSGSGVTQPISGTVAANAGTNLNTSALALENGGNLATIAGSVSSGKVQVNVTNSSIPVTGTFYQATQPVSNAGTFAVQAAQSGTWNIGSITTLPSLPAGSSLIGAVNIEASGTALTTTGSSLNVNITGVSSSNPLPVVGSVAKFQPSVSGVTANTYAPLNTDVAGNLYVDLQNQDIFGAYVFQSRNPQFEVNHSSGLDTTLITPTVTGNGTATWAQGGVTLSTTANASSSYSLTSVQSLEYGVGFEWFSYFTVAFLNGSAPGSSQRIGLFNGSPTSPQDGFFIGYEGSVFGISQFQGGVGLLSFNSNVSPSIPITSFNTDQCNGTAGSAFTLNGTPVAINVNNINLFRLRGGWLGTGIVVLEVCSPDGEWVTMHTFNNPNSLTSSYTYSTNWLYQASVQNGTNNTALSMFLGGASFGSTDSKNRMTDAITGTTLATTARSVLFGQYNTTVPTTPAAGTYTPLQTDLSSNLKVVNPDNIQLDSRSIITTGIGTAYNTTGYGIISFQFSGVWNGFLNILGSNDGTNWFPLWVNGADGTVLDYVSENGIFTVSVVSKYIAYNFLNLTGTANIVVLGKSSPQGVTPLLAQALDSTSNVQLNTNIINLGKDSNNALILSDAPAPLPISGEIGRAHV